MAVGDTLQARGRVLVEQTAGGVGCAACHGMDGKGRAALSTPDIRGAGQDRVRAALAAVTLMKNIMLTDDEIAAVVEHLRVLNDAP